MIVHTAHLTCQDGISDGFKARLLLHAKNTLVAEPGCLQFEIHQDRDLPERFFLYEVYTDAQALALHREAPHYIAFREETKDLVIDRVWWFWELIA